MPCCVGVVWAYLPDILEPAWNQSTARFGGTGGTAAQLAALSAQTGGTAAQLHGGSLSVQLWAGCRKLGPSASCRTLPIMLGARQVQVRCKLGARTLVHVGSRATVGGTGGTIWRRHTLAGWRQSGGTAGGTGGTGGGTLWRGGGSLAAELAALETLANSVAWCCARRNSLQYSLVTQAVCQSISCQGNTNMAAMLVVLAAAWRQCRWQQRHSGGSDGTVGGILAALAGGLAALWRHNCHSAALGGMAAQFGGSGGTAAAQSGHNLAARRHDRRHWRHSATGGTGGTLAAQPTLGKAGSVFESPPSQTPMLVLKPLLPVGTQIE
eukprot:gene1073-biopygen2811